MKVLFFHAAPIWRYAIFIISMVMLSGCGNFSSPQNYQLLPGIESTLAAQTLTAINSYRLPASTPEPMRNDLNLYTSAELAPALQELEITEPLQTSANPETTSEPLAAVCTNRAEFVADVSIPDHTRVAGGQRFTKTWRFKNAGTCTWTPEYSLVFVWGDLMDGKDRLSIGKNIPPGESIDVSIDLVAPEAASTYQGNWMFEDGYGNRFGTGYLGRQFFWVAVNVGGGGGGRDLFSSLSGGCIGGG